MQNTAKNLICFSHLRWNFVYQRPQHIITKLSTHFKTFYMEEPIFDAIDNPHHCFTEISDSLIIIVPHLQPGLSEDIQADQLKSILQNILSIGNGQDYIFWYYTPMALEFTQSFSPIVTIYDCMDELSAFNFAPSSLKALELKLMTRADLVFTGGHTLYEEKKKYHNSIYPFPSSIDKSHFGKARYSDSSPQDQQLVSGTKVGFFGVVDERFDIDLLKEMAEMRPEWQFIIIGPVVKIDPESLPSLVNIHYLGQRSYQELPAYLSGWDIALIPFLLNESTKYISPTKTPEYLAAGIPVVSSAITDVVNPYGINKLVTIGSNAQDFVDAAETALARSDKKEWLAEVDSFLEFMSWEDTTTSMLKLINKKLSQNLNLKELANV